MNFLEKIWIYFVFFIALFPLLPRVVESILMISLFVTSLVLFFLKKEKVKKNSVFTVLLFSSVFIIYLISLFYSTNVKSGLKYIQRVLPLFAFPLIFGILHTSKITVKRLSTIESVYVFSITVGLVFCQLFFIVNNEGIQTNWDYRNAVEKLTDVHGTYISLWIGFGLIISLKKIIYYFKNKNVLFLIIFSLFSVYCIYWQIKIGARMPLIATIVSIVVFFIQYIKQKNFFFTSFSLIVLLVVVFTFITPTYYNRLIELKNHKFELPKGDYNIDFDKISNEHIRNGIYYCSGMLIKESWLIGYGIGDVDEKLQSCYDTKIESNVYNIFNFNSHNQYLHILLSSGVFGLLFFLVSIFLSVYLAIKNKDYLFLAFSVLTILCLLTENILSRHDGILFYSFFNSIFAFKRGN